MKLLLYASSLGYQAEERHKKMILRAVSEDSLVICRSFEGFKQTLNLYRNEHPIVLIYVETIQDVCDLMEMADWFDGLDLIIASGSDDSAVVSQCRKLYPRLICTNEQDMSVAVTVIKKRFAQAAL